MENLQTPKGFRDFLPLDARKRRFVLEKITTVFEKYGFAPLETPALEYSEVLKGKYGEEEKLIYEFTDRGGRKLALRYDQTVPLARVIAQYPDLPKPFKRYQIQPVYRAENTQKGRYREFLQCDIDTVGTASILADTEVIAAALEIAASLGLNDAKMLINDRAVFAGLEAKYVSAIDKLAKIGAAGVVAELIAKGMTEQKAQETLTKIKNAGPTASIKKICADLKKFNSDFKIEFTPTLARGLNYYTGAIFELTVGGENSIGGGGRYDKLIGMFSKQDIPAVGFSFGFDRLVETLEEKNLFSEIDPGSQVLVTIFNPDLLENSFAVLKILREKEIKAEIYLDPETKLDKQLKFADQKGIRFAVIIGPEEDAKNQVTLKDLNSKSQTQISLEKLIQILS